METSELPHPVTSQDMYMAAVVVELRALREMLASVLDPAADGTGFDEERLRSILVEYKGIGEVTAERIIEAYKAGR